MSIDFKGSHYPKEVILYAVFFYVRYAVSYRDLEDIMAERGVQLDHATLNRWVVKYSPGIAKAAQMRKMATAGSWRMDETYIKIKGEWTTSTELSTNTPLVHCCAIPCRAVGKTLDFMLSRRRDKAAARLFFRRAIKTNGVPERIVIDKSGANLARLQGLPISRSHARWYRSSSHDPKETIPVKPYIAIQTICLLSSVDARECKLCHACENFATEPMSPAWVRKRIQSVFGRRQADDILEGYEPMIMRVDKDGNVKESLNNGDFAAYRMPIAARIYDISLFVTAFATVLPRSPDFRQTPPSSILARGRSWRAA